METVKLLRESVSIMKKAELGNNYSKESWKPLGIFCLNQKEKGDIYSKSSFSRVIDYEQRRAKRMNPPLPLSPVHSEKVKKIKTV